MNWKETDDYPLGDRVWAVKYRDCTKYISEDDAKSYAKKVSNYLGIGGPLISSPETERFLPIIQHPTFHNYMLRLILNKLRGIIFSFALAALLCLFFALDLVIRKQNTELLMLSVTMILTFGLQYCLYLQARNHKKQFLDWVIYLDWSRRHSRIFLVVFALMMLMPGAIQLVSFLVGREENEIFIKYGVVFKLIDQNEYWRFLVGPFFHVNFIHWMINFIFILLMAPNLAPFKSKLLVIFLGVLSIILSAVIVYVQYLMGYGGSGIAGASALIYFILGISLANVVLYRSYYPKTQLPYLLLFSIIALISPHAFPNNVSFTAHFSGLVWGLICGFLLKPAAHGRDV
jgi:membrane associated rhomboid family serine protease